MLAYNNDPKLKKSIIRVMREHYEADEIIHGTYWDEGKGCAVGCSVDAINKTLNKRLNHGNHAASEAIGIPQSLYRLQDLIFEGLNNGAAQKFPLDFANAIKPGADLSKVTAQFLVWCLLDKKHGAIRQAPKDKFADCHNAILASAAIWQTYIKTGRIDAATAAARLAAAAASAAARSAARSARAATESAAAASAAAWSAARLAAAAESAAAESAAAESAAAESAAAASAAARSAAAASAAWAKRDFWKAASVTLIKLLKKQREQGALT